MFYIKKQGQSQIHVTVLAALRILSFLKKVRILIIEIWRMHHQLPLVLH